MLFNVGFAFYMLLLHTKNDILILLFLLLNQTGHMQLVTAADSRADHHHQTVAKGSNSNHEVGQRQPEFQKADGPLVVIISVEKDRIFAVALRKEDRQCL